MNPIHEQATLNEELTVTDPGKKTIRFNNCNKTENALWIFFYMKMIDAYWKAKI
jgi:hypothetical protein